MFAAFVRPSRQAPSAGDTALTPSELVEATTVQEGIEEVAEDVSAVAGALAKTLNPVESTPTATSPFAVNYDVDSQVQKLGTIESAFTFTKGTGWPTSGTFGYVLLLFTTSGTPELTWTLVNHWTPEEPADDATYLVHLRQISGEIYASAEVVQ